MHRRTISLIAVPNSEKCQEKALPLPIALGAEELCEAIAASIFASQLMDDRNKKTQQKSNKPVRKPEQSTKQHMSTESDCKCCCPNMTDVEYVDIKSINHYGTTTVVKWSDGTKTIAVCDKDDKFNPEAGFAIAVAKKFMGNAAFHEALEYIQNNMPPVKEKKPVVTETVASTETTSKETTDKTEKKATKSTTKTSSKKTTAKKK